MAYEALRRAAEIQAEIAGANWRVACGPIKAISANTS